MQSLAFGREALEKTKAKLKIDFETCGIVLAVGVLRIGNKKFAAQKRNLDLCALISRLLQV